MGKIDVKRLKAELRETAKFCRAAREGYSNAQRSKGDPIPVWVTAMERDKASWRMTKLCVFRAFLRGKDHIVRTVMEIDKKQIVDDLAKEFALAT